MRMTIEPTEETYNVPVNGGTVPVRIWSGTTEGGVAVEAYVLSITPDPATEENAMRLKAELPSFMQPTRETMTIDVERAEEVNR